MSMTPKERWHAILRGETPDRLPTDYWTTPEFHEKLKRALGCNEDEAVYERLGIDRPYVVAPRLKLAHHPDDPAADLWGVRMQRVDHGSGAYDEVVCSPLASAETPADIDRFRWPEPDDFDYTTVERAVAEDPGRRVIQGGWFEPFLMYARMRGMEQAYEDLLLWPEVAERMFERLFDICFEYNRRIFEAGGGRIELFLMAEDLGSQNGPLFSVETYRRFFRDGQRQMADLARSYGAHVMYHTDGAARAFLPDLVEEVGIEVLNPIQWRCEGMDCAGLAQDFGDRLVFHGGIDNQQTLPFASPDEVAREVRAVREAFGDARWICAPCHNIQSLTPVENVIAMYETARTL